MKDLILIKTILNPSFTPVKGEIKATSFEKVKFTIHENLMCSWGPTQVPDTVEVFWQLVSQYFFSPPSTCYEHIPDPGSCFDFRVQWNFCFILLNEHKQGIILDAGAVD